MIRGGFHKSWAQGVKRKADSNQEENTIAGPEAQIHDAKLGKKDGCKAQISRVRVNCFMKSSPGFFVKLSSLRFSNLFSRLII
jgi:hypothetical protein